MVYISLMRIALCTVPPFASHTQAVINALEAADVQLELYDIPTELSDPEAAQSFDAAWMRIAPHAVVTGRTPMYWQAAISLEMAGIPLLNSTRSHEIVGNKLLSAIAMQNAGLPQPYTQLLSDVNVDQLGSPFICKPIGGARAEGVVLVQNLEEAHRHAEELDQTCIVQTFIASSSCIRVVATPERAVRIYEKRVSTDQPIASVAHGADRVIVDDPGGEMADLACKIVAACGGGLMGVDLLKANDGTLWALEINGSFAFDPDDDLICQAFVDELCARGRGRSRASAGGRASVTSRSRL